MKKQEEKECIELVREMVDIFDDGNIDIVEAYYDEYTLTSHPDVIRFKEILEELKEILE